MVTNSSAATFKPDLIDKTGMFHEETGEYPAILRALQN
jgi:hypothetical protein